MNICSHSCWNTITVVCLDYKENEYYCSVLRKKPLQGCALFPSIQPFEIPFFRTTRTCSDSDLIQQLTRKQLAGLYVRAAATTHARTYVRVTTTIPRRDKLSWTSAQQDEDEEERGGEEDFPHCLKIGLDLAVVANSCCCCCCRWPPCHKCC